MSLFNYIPNDLLSIILDYSDTEYAFHICELCPEFDSLNLMREKVWIQSGLRCNDYDMNKLKEISKVRYSRNICAGILNSFVIKSGHVSIFGNSRERSILLSGISDIISISPGYN